MAVNRTKEDGVKALDADVPSRPFGLVDTERVADYLEKLNAEMEKNYPGIHKYSIGYQSLLQEMTDFFEYPQKDNYPFHTINVKHIYDSKSSLKSTEYQITMAVSGFTAGDLSVSLIRGTLYIDGEAPKGTAQFKVNKNSDDSETVVLSETTQYSGIAARNFHRSFLLTPWAKVRKAFLDNGMLVITVVEEYPVEYDDVVDISVKEGTSDIPILYIDKSEPNPSYPGAEIVYVYCDECLKYHTHGMPEGNDGKYEPEHRSPHCVNKDGKYSSTGYMIAYKKIVEA
jgi:HSP20 family molecular chaperone IbpA